MQRDMAAKFYMQKHASNVDGRLLGVLDVQVMYFYSDVIWTYIRAGLV